VRLQWHHSERSGVCLELVGVFRFVLASYQEGSPDGFVTCARHEVWLARQFPEAAPYGFTSDLT
jgi:hypothetical protein